MFKNHSINVKFVKDAKAAPTQEDTKNPFINDETVAHAKEIIKHVGVAVIVTSVVSIACKTLGSIAVVVTEAAVNQKEED